MANWRCDCELCREYRMFQFAGSVAIGFVFGVAMMLILLTGCTDHRQQLVQQEAQAAFDHLGVEAPPIVFKFSGLPLNGNGEQIAGVTLGPVILLDADYFPRGLTKLDCGQRSVVRHEAVHVLQGMRVGFGNWILWYALHREEAEAEAYAVQREFLKGCRR